MREERAEALPRRLHAPATRHEFFALISFDADAASSPPMPVIPCSLRAGLVVGVTAALGAVIAPAAGAVSLDLTVNGQRWRLDTVTTTYVASQGLFNTPAAGGSMPWWGDGTGTLATAFATALLAADPSQSVFGYPNSGTGGTANQRSPFFAWEWRSTAPNVSYVSIELPTPSISPDGANSYKLNQATSREWFIASAIQQVPGPLPLFGAAAAFGWSRRLRRRLHRSIGG